MKRTFVCASSYIKQYVQPSYGFRGTPVVTRTCVYTARKNYLIHKMSLQKSTGTRTKNILKNEQKVGMLLQKRTDTRVGLKNEQKVGMLLQKRTDTRGVGISSMRKSIYLLTTTPSSHTHRFHQLPLATPASSSPHPYIPPTLHNCHPYF